MQQSIHVSGTDVSDVRVLRVLLVEDDATIAAVIVGLIEAQGHEVRHAAHGLAALSELDAGTFDVALIDFDLPGIDGLVLARMLRAREAAEDRPRIHLIGLTARSVGNEEALALEVGMDAFLRKPLGGAKLRACFAAVDMTRDAVHFA